MLYIDFVIPVIKSSLLATLANRCDPAMKSRLCRFIMSNQSLEIASRWSHKSIAISAKELPGVRYVRFQI